MLSHDDVPQSPHSVEAEQSVLGSVLIDHSVFDRVDFLRADDFYRADHKAIWGAVVALRAADSPVDVVLVSEYLDAQGTSDVDLGYLGTIARNVPMMAHALAYAEVIRNHAARRNLSSILFELGREAMSFDSSVEGLLSRAEREVFALADRGTRQSEFVDLRAGLRDLVAHITELHENPPADGLSGASLGLTDLDAATGGAEGGDLIIIAGRPSMGKTALALNMSVAIAKQQKPVVVFSMEMAARQLVARAVSAEAGIPLRTVLKTPWTMRDEDFVCLGNVLGNDLFSKAPLYIDDMPGLSVREIRSRCRRLASQLRSEYPEGLGAVMVDYIQLGGDDGVATNREGQVSEFSRGLKAIAKEFNCPVIALSQLNRGLEQRQNKRPIMSDLRESGAIEQDADVIMFVYRDEVYNEDSPAKGTAEIIIAKQRNGALATVRTSFEGQYTRFGDLAHGAFDEGSAPGGSW